jgi:outer membrane immunogenic protein
MKKLNTSVALAALAAIFLAAPAVAADVEAPMPEAANWTAFHVGVGGGGMFGFVQEDANSFINDNNDFFVFGEHSADLGEANWFGTVEAGFDYQIDSVVVGVLANYDFGKTKMKNKSNTFVFNNNSDTIDDNATFETKWEIGDTWAVGARAGFLAMDNALIYVTGGYTQANIKAESDLHNDFANPQFPFNESFHSSDSGWEDGWFVGGGIEALLTDNISLKAEYRYADYGKVNRDDSIDTNPGSESEFFFAESSQEGDVTVHTVRAVLSYRFGLF